GEHKTGVDLALASGGTRVSGTVSDVGGGAVIGAHVTFSIEQEMPWGAPKLLALTGNDGKYEIYLAPADYSASVTHDDYIHAYRSIEVQTAPLTVDFVLSPGGSIRGTVVTRDGKPLPGATVMASGSRGRSGGGGFERADDKGEFTMRGLGSGAISLTA